MSITKTKQASEKYRKGDIKGAVVIFSSFKIGITKSEKRSLEIFKECLTGKSDFYKSLGINTDEEKSKSISVIESKLLNQ